MKIVYQKLIAVLLFGWLPVMAIAQQPSAAANLEAGDIRAQILNGGDLFWDLGTAAPSFEAPKVTQSGQTSRHTMYSAALWIGGLDQQGDLHAAAMTYRQNGVDYWAGPMDTTTGTASASQVAGWDAIYEVTQAEVENFVNGGPATAAIKNWPANPQFQGETQNLAPYVEVNGLAGYQWDQGDYPDVCGNQALYWVFNDSYNQHSETGAQPLGVEVHAKAFAMNSPDDAISKTIFVSYRIVNRSENTYDSLYIGMFSDFDIGYGFDDYIGSVPDANSFFAYNGDPFDDGASGYGDYPPMQSVTFLNQPLSKFIAYNNDFSIRGNPQVPAEYYGYLKGTWRDHSRMTKGGNGYGGTIPINFMYDGDPNNQQAWSEVTTSSTVGDRRGIGSTGPYTFAPGETVRLDVAFTFHQDSTTPSNTVVYADMLDRIKAVQTFYDQGFSGYCTRSLTALSSQPEPIAMKLYPNPTKGMVRLELDEPAQQVQVVNAVGQIVLQQELKGKMTNELDVSMLPAGIYQVKVTSAKGVGIKNLLVVE